jgi:hypothetical protein
MHTHYLVTFLNMQVRDVMSEVDRLRINFDVSSKLVIFYN